jgi:hypothetical protein
MMSTFVLIALFALKHFLASYPLQCSYTVKGLGSTDWVKPMLARAGVQAVCTALLAVGYWMVMGKATNLPLLAMVAGIDFVSHFLIDRVKVSKEFLGHFMVASSAELQQAAIDYTSPNRSVVAAAQAKSDSNKYFWWADGLIHLVYALIGLGMAYLIQ